MHATMHVHYSNYTPKLHRPNALKGVKSPATQKLSFDYAHLRPFIISSEDTWVFFGVFIIKRLRKMLSIHRLR